MVEFWTTAALVLVAMSYPVYFLGVKKRAANPNPDMPVLEGAEAD